MDFERRAVAFRKAVARRGSVGPRLRYTAELRAEAVAYAEERLASGAMLTAVTRELGLGGNTLRAWLAAERQSPRFRKVEIAAEETAATLVVTGPCGLRIEGLDIATLSELIRRLR